MSTYPAYQIPDATGIQWSSGQGTLQAFPGNYLCTKVQADAIHAVTGGQLVNAALSPVPNVTEIVGVKADSPLQPWWIVGGGKNGGINGPIGPAYQLQSQYNSTNGGGEGSPGAWNLDANNKATWTPWAIAPLPAPPIDSSGDPAAWAQLQGAGQGFSAADALTLADMRRLVVAMAKAQGIV